ncbi:MAG: branched-chain amino acid--2-keto-4-methylthiobutyrate aminotransferase [bacterium]|nr:branched-chain amino acid--2-keto-4-methylthiobutyrate aminotransferase [bacterium]
MEIIRAAEIMATHPEHQRLPHPQNYALGGAFTADHHCGLIEASVPLIDCGFMHADAVYDVVSVSRGAFFRLDQHQDRLARSCEAIHLQNPMNRKREAEILHETVALSGLKDAYVWWAVTRGLPPLGRGEMIDPQNFQPRFYAFASPFVWLADDDQRARGLDLVLSRERVRISPRAVDPTAKNFHWLDMQMALFEAGERGGEWAMLPDEDGYLTEATGANVFVIRDGVALTPDSGCLEGITRQSVFDLCAELGIHAKATRIHSSELEDAEEIFLTTTAGSIMPVRTIDGRAIGGREGPGEIATTLHNRYWEHRWDGWDTTPVRYELAK